MAGKTKASILKARAGRMHLSVQEISGQGEEVMQRNEKRGVGVCNADLITGGKGRLAKCTKRCKYIIEKGKCKDYMSNRLH